MGLTMKERKTLLELQERAEEPSKPLTRAQLNLVEKRVVKIRDNVGGLNFVGAANNLWAALCKDMYELAEINARLVDEIRQLHERPAQAIEEGGGDE